MVEERVSKEWERYFVKEKENKVVLKPAPAFEESKNRDTTSGKVDERIIYYGEV